MHGWTKMFSPKKLRQTLLFAVKLEIFAFWWNLKVTICQMLEIN